MSKAEKIRIIAVCLLAWAVGMYLGITRIINILFPDAWYVQLFEKIFG
jgi:hypothetical protein